MGLIQQEDKKNPLCPAYLMHSTVLKLTYSTYCIVAMVTLQYTVSHMAYIYIGVYIYVKVKTTLSLHHRTSYSLSFGMM